MNHLQPPQAPSYPTNPIISFSLPLGSHQKVDSKSPETCTNHLAEIADLKARVKKLEDLFHRHVNLDSDGQDRHSPRPKHQETVRLNPNKRQKRLDRKPAEQQKLHQKELDLERRPDLLAARQQQRERRDTSANFAGRIEDMDKVKLRDLAYALGLFTTGIKADLLARIRSHFNAVPSLHEDPRYAHLLLFASPSHWQQPSQQPSPVQSQAPTAGPSYSDLQGQEFVSMPDSQAFYDYYNYTIVERPEL
ncbi:hypothetical protein BJ912DRAFT_82761 [Pholiota molesta]|nr:hypothetical protein BJ912DRAFT_82761 [Pholiota molesta]